ncbi:MAG TPA: rhodanese-like domain-containing protein, partial [Roseomonas sp.]|nr:rhodanese-like domain-containing protein [Roseomonas sp.]
IGRMLVYDGLDLSFDTVSLAKNPACPCCSKPANDIVLRAEQMVCSAPVVGQALTPEALRARIDAGEEMLLLDVRNPDEWLGGTLPGALRIAKPEIERAVQSVLEGEADQAEAVLGAIPRNRDVLVYCQSGMRSSAAIRALVSAGYNPARLFNLERGFAGWRREVDQ